MGLGLGCEKMRNGSWDPAHLSDGIAVRDRTRQLEGTDTIH